MSARSSVTLPATASRVAGVPLGAALLALALPVLFIHADHLPAVSVGAAGTSVRVTLSDLAVLATIVAAAFESRRTGVGVLRAGKPIWLASAVLLMWIGFSTVWPALTDDGYRASDHVVSALKFGEYALLAPAVPLLLHDLRGVRVVLFALAAWSAVAALIGIAQFLGADIFDAWATGRRQPSFLGHHDLAALSVAALSFTLVALLLRSRPKLTAREWLGGVGGWLGLVLSGAVTATAGLLAGTLAAMALARRCASVGAGRVLVVGAISATCAVGVVSLRGGDLLAFARFLGANRIEQDSGVESYSHRTLLAYLGSRIYLDHPYLGAGWQASVETRVFAPYLDDARRRFPRLDDEAFPGPGREFGVQNVYVQLLADTGPVGLLAFLAVLLTTILSAIRALGRLEGEWRTVAIATCAVTLGIAGTWMAQGMWPGLPLTALTWLVAGLAATVANQARMENRNA